MLETPVLVATMNALLGRYSDVVTGSCVVVAEHEGRWREAAIALTPEAVYVVVPSAGETVVALDRATLRYDAGLPFVGSPARIGDAARSLAIRSGGRRRLQLHESIHPGVPAPFLESDVPASAYRPLAGASSATGAIGAVVWLTVSSVIGLIAASAVPDGQGSMGLVVFVETTTSVGALGLLIAALIGHFMHPRER